MEISDIKQRLTLQTVLQHYGLQPDKNSRLNCPFHDDKTPSMQGSTKTNNVYCFSGNCKTHGKSLDVIDFIMNKESVGGQPISKHEAITKAKSMLGVEGFVLNKPKLEYRDLPMDNLEDIFYKMKLNLKQSKTAQAYCEQRNLNPENIEIGYNGRTYKGLFHCIIFPLKNKAAKITSLYGRSSVNNTESKHYYLKDSNGLYPNYPSREARHLIITESIIDAASLLQIKSITENYSVLAAFGTNRLNEEIKTAITELTNLSEIVFAFDNDQAGEMATAKYTKELKTILPNIKYSRLSLPNKDINETLQAHNEEIFTHLLKNRTEFFFSSETSTEKERPIVPDEPLTKEFLQAIFSNEIIASPARTSPQEIKAESLDTRNPHKLIYKTASANYTLKGGVDKQMNKLTVTLEIESHAMTKSRNKVDLYEDKQVEKLANEVAEKLHLNYKNLIKDLHDLTEELDSYRETQQQQEETDLAGLATTYMLNTQEKKEATDLANDPNLIETIKAKLTQTGIVGEDENKTFLFIVAVSHIQENPLNALIQGSSGSGKTRLLKQIFYCMPDENKKIFSRCSEKMLYNVPKYYFKNKLVCFEDVDGLGEEAEYAWRELVSNGELISGVSYKDEKGNIGIKELTVYGPITSIACTTRGAVYADNMSRLFLIAIDESKAQTQRINEYQAAEAQGLISKHEQKKAIQQLQNYVRILSPYIVHNPFATKLKLPENIRDERRLYRLYLYFIDMITVLHQTQRQKTKDHKLIATKQDCQIAKDLMFECIMLKMDELDGSLRQFFERLKEYVQKHSASHEFTQREIREALQVKKTQLSYYINELISLEYIQQTSSHINRGNKYKVLYFDNYQKVRADVKDFLQKQIDELKD